MKDQYLTDDYFEYYRDNIKTTVHKKRSLKAKDYVVRDDYGKMLQEYYLAISKMMIYDAYTHYNSNKMGCLNVVKYEPDMLDKDGNIRPRMLKVNWKATKDLWAETYGTSGNDPALKEIKGKTLIYHENDHSDGWMFRWNWDRSTSLMKHQSRYYYKPVKANKRMLATAIQTMPGLDFTEIEINTNLK
jgi:hypothetical protein